MTVRENAEVAEKGNTMATRDQWLSVQRAWARIAAAHGDAGAAGSPADLTGVRAAGKECRELLGQIVTQARRTQIGPDMESLDPELIQAAYLYVQTNRLFDPPATSDTARTGRIWDMIAAGNQTIATALGHAPE
jgi:cytochrome P450